MAESSAPTDRTSNARVFAKLGRASPPLRALGERRAATRPSSPSPATLGRAVWSLLAGGARPSTELQRDVHHARPETGHLDCGRSPDLEVGRQALEFSLSERALIGQAKRDGRRPEAGVRIGRDRAVSIWESLPTSLHVDAIIDEAQFAPHQTSDHFACDFTWGPERPGVGRFEACALVAAHHERRVMSVPYLVGVPSIDSETGREPRRAATRRLGDRGFQRPNGIDRAMRTSEPLTRHDEPEPRAGSQSTVTFRSSSASGVSSATASRPRFRRVTLRRPASMSVT